jgi:hypothetical protein
MPAHNYFGMRWITHLINRQPVYSWNCGAIDQGGVTFSVFSTLYVRIKQILYPRGDEEHGHQAALQ